MHAHVRTFGKGVALFLLFFSNQNASAQKSPQELDAARQRVLSDKKVNSIELSEKTQTPSFISFKEGVLPKGQARTALAQYVQARSGVDYLVQSRETQVTGDMEVIEYQQFYKGLRVEHAGYKALVKNGQVRFFNGTWYDVPATLLPQAKLQKGAALEVAKRKSGAKKFAADVIEEKIRSAKDLRIKAELQKELSDADSKGELVVVRDFTKDGVAQVKLAYKFNIYGAEPISRAWIYVDANNGNVLLVDPIIKHSNPNPPAASLATQVQTRYAGNRSIYVKQVSGNDPQSGLPLTSSHPTSEPLYVPGSSTWILMDDTRGGGIETYDMNGVGGLPLSLPSLYLQGKSFTDADNNWTVAEHKRGGGEGGIQEAENDDIAWDAHWGAEMVYDYWKIRQNRLSYDGKNAKIKSFIHYGPAYDNAFWNGSSMTYGDGSGITAGGFKALTSLDVCGHEIGHGVCEFTANLVYEKESGAMNEGFSDIWAACVEYYALTKIDATLASVYRPFYIGEQIGATLDNPLRRMDNPKATSNPDTYGGTNFDNPDCAPDLTNDYCGVHNNSGLLNKWFYLLTVGSGKGSGPDARFARADSDDGVNDAVSGNAVEGTHGANVYSVTGLGFTASEKIAYLTELLFSATATFREARTTSIAVTTELYGSSCSSQVEAVTNAWYAVGIGAKFVKPCSITYGFIFQPGAAVTEAQTPSGCTSEKTLPVSILMPPSSTATFALSGTATNGHDYTLSATSVSNTATTAGKKIVNLVVKNDGSIEGDETVVLTATISNVGTNKVNKTTTITILNDDVVPVIGSTTKKLLSSTFTQSDGFAEPSGWSEIMEFAEAPNGDPAAGGKNQWGVFGGKLAITGKDGITGTKLLNGTYNPLSQSRTLARTPQIDARGLSVLKIKFDFRVQGEVDPLSTNPSSPDLETLPAFDYMAVAYSIDGVKFTELNTGDFGQFASLAPKTGTFMGTLPASLNNQKFYLAFRWSNDANAGGPESVTIDNLEVTGAARKIENTLNNNGRELLKPGSEVYFYSVQEGEVLGKVKNGSTKDYGCTNLWIEKTGNSAFNLYQGSDGLHKVSSKILRVEPTVMYSGSNVVTLYYTEAQLAELERASGKSRSTFQVYRVNAAAYTGATSANVKKYKPIYSAIPGTGGSFTVVFSDFVNGSYALGTVVSTFGVQSQTSAIAPKASKPTESFSGTIYPNPAPGAATYSITSPVRKTVNVEILGVGGQVLNTQRITLSAGTTQVPLNLSRLSTGAYTVRLTDGDGMLLQTTQMVKK